MSVQSPLAQSVGGKLDIAWQVMGSPAALCVQLATDNEFIHDLRTFVLPVVTSVTLDCGSGEWYYRLGAWVGDHTSGAVEWTGVYGPALVVTSSPRVPIVASPVGIVHTQAIQHGLRLHTGNLVPMYFVVESSLDGRFPASATTTQYVLDWGRGYTDCLDLRFGQQYSVRFGVFQTAKLSLPEIRQVGAWQVVHNKSAARPVRPINSTAVSTGRADAALLREASQTPFVRFTSHSDYLRFKAAEARSKEEKNGL